MHDPRCNDRFEGLHQWFIASACPRRCGEIAIIIIVITETGDVTRRLISKWVARCFLFRDTISIMLITANIANGWWNWERLRRLIIRSPFGCAWNINDGRQYNRSYHTVLRNTYANVYTCCFIAGRSNMPQHFIVIFSLHRKDNHTACYFKSIRTSNMDNN